MPVHVLLIFHSRNQNFLLPIQKFCGQGIENLQNYWEINFYYLIYSFPVNIGGLIRTERFRRNHPIAIPAKEKFGSMNELITLLN